MAISSIEYDFEELPVGEFICSGVALVEFDHEAEWIIDSVVLTGKTDANGDERDDYVSVDAVKAALIAKKSQRISDAVIEVLVWA